jgi:hypothetical protein
VSAGPGLYSGTDPDQERDAPAQPTRVTFPAYEAAEAATNQDTAALSNLESLFAKVLRPTDIGRHHAQALNIELHPPCDIDHLLPAAPNGKTYLPPLDTDSEDAKTGVSFGDAYKAFQLQKEFNIRVAELRVDNDGAFRTLTRTVKKDVKPYKISYMRKFWEGLESMSQYWDCSLDQYYEISNSHTSTADGEQSAKRQRLDSKYPITEADGSSVSISKQIDTDLNKFAAALGPHAPDYSPSPTEASNGNGASPGESIAVRSPSTTPEHEPNPETKLRYKGRRTNTGKEMPDSFRAETVRAFVEGAAWPFQFSIAPPRMMPVTQFGKLNLPVRQSAAVYRMPKDRMRARQGRLEGPMVALQVRAEVDFAAGDENSVEAKARLDLLREMGGLLQIAQERRRDGKQEVKPGEGKWWTTKPRWGGGPGGEVENVAGNGDVVEAAEEILDGVKDQKVKREKDGSRARRKKTPAMLWKELKCGSSHWDPVKTVTPDDAFLFANSMIEDGLHGHWQGSVITIR